MDILLIEDFVAIRKLVAHRLNELPGVRVVGEAAGQAEALALFKQTQPDVVVTDLSLADGSGLGFVGELRRRGFTGHVAVMTARDLDPYRLAAEAVGVNGMYDKGTGLERMFQDLQQIDRGAAAPAHC